MPEEQAMVWLQHHITTWTGYAFALAQKASLSPEEAARMFMEPLRAYVGSQTQADSQLLEQQAKQSAATMALMHGQNNVQLDHDEDRWLMKTIITAEKQNLQQWGVSVEFFTRWLGEQARLVGEPKGIVYTTWLEDDMLYIQLTLQPGK
jgi:hypothetical protein